MILPETYTTALLLTIVTMICWGSWANSYKLAGKWRFELFYWDYAIGVLLAAVVVAFTFGALGFDVASNGRGLPFPDDLLDSGRRNWAYGFGAGVIFNLANILLVAAIAVAGMSVAFPVGIGLALVIGVVWNYAIKPQGNAVLLFTGVGIVLAAIVVDALAYRALSLAKAKATLKAGKNSAVPKVGWKGIVLSVASGLLMGAFYPLVELGKQSGPGLGPYAIGFVFAFGIFCSTFVFNFFFMNLPVEGEPVEILDYFKGTKKQHALGVIGGVIWTAGTLSNFAVSSAPDAHVGPAISYALGQGATLISALWGLLVWKEFRGADARVKILLTAMLVLFGGGLALVSIAPLYGR